MIKHQVYAIAITMCWLCTLIALSLRNKQHEKLQNEAIERGHAEWYIHKDRSVKFRWKTHIDPQTLPRHFKYREAKL
jgi:hypothetical protein